VSIRQDLEQAFNHIILSDQGIDAIVLFDGKAGLKLIANTQANEHLISQALLVRAEAIAASFSQLRAGILAFRHFADVTHGGQLSHALFDTEELFVLIYFFDINSYPTYLACIGSDKEKKAQACAYVESAMPTIYQLLVSGVV